MEKTVSKRRMGWITRAERKDGIAADALGDTVDRPEQLVQGGRKR
jgi:hypothetical protein